MTIARIGLKVNVKVMSQANAVSPTSMEGTLVSSCVQHLDLVSLYAALFSGVRQV